MDNALAPDIERMSDGNWLATAPQSRQIRVGVFGTTEADARERFAQALVLRRQLYQLAKAEAGGKER